MDSLFSGTAQAWAAKKLILIGRYNARFLRRGIEPEALADAFHIRFGSCWGNQSASASAKL